MDLSQDVWLTREPLEFPWKIEPLCLSDSASPYRRADLPESPTTPLAACVTSCHWAPRLCHCGHLWPASWGSHPSTHPSTHTHTHSHTHTHIHSLLIRFSFFLFKINLYCSIVSLQCYVRFTAKWVSCMYTYIPPLLDFLPIGHHRALTRVSCVAQ